ncbi:AMP-binding protein [Legionella quateirensis]|uniref:Acetyltransferase n=1 Tax=Legionella quateirensis TaxID=45072 RepID=A0A378KXD5_9GAMM|nr:AMP-binding protein [Legionella quateirensis]KTD43378.1 acetyltransferase [Legionella quateirensis]STY18261.1 acetyltransferase [Legionella quateirensis]
MTKEANQQAVEEQVLSIVREFMTDLDAERGRQAVTLAASLDRDIGIDSLGKVELFRRIEKAFSLQLPERALVDIESLNDLTQVIIECCHTVSKHKVKHFTARLGITDIDLTSAKTLIEVLTAYATKEAQRPHLFLQHEQGEEEIISYAQLLKEAEYIAQGLNNKGIKQGDTVAIMLPTSAEFFYAFCGVLLSGAIPVPIYPPFRPDRIEEYTRREARILHNAEVRILITFSEAATLSKILSSFVPSLKEVTTLNQLKMTTGSMPMLDLDPQSPVLIQYTSGSTGDPKGVLINHNNMLSNIRAIGKAIPVQRTDAVVSWLPLYHDMGLMSWLGAMYFGVPITILSPLTFLTRPERWLWALHYHRATLSGGPNFAYELCIKKINPEDIEGLDLSSWRFAFNGAEALNPKTMERFSKKFSPYGFKLESFAPVYGLAEATVGLTFPLKRRKPLIDRVQRDVFEQTNKAIPASQNEGALNFVGCGVPLINHEVRIVDADDNEVEERSVGSIQFKGPSAMQGYFNNLQATQKAYHQGWWDTGDLGYLADKELFITGRKKDLIIKAGRNLYPEEIEEIVNLIPNIRKGCVIAFGVNDQSNGTEQLIVVAETNEHKKETQIALRAAIIDKMAIELGIVPDHIVLVPPKTVPKTSSGKLQRSACKQAFIQGILVKNKTSAQWQMGRLILMSACKKIYNALCFSGKLVYTFYLGIIFLLTLFPAWLVVLLASHRIGARVTHWGARIWFRLAMCPISIEGTSNLTDKKPMIFVSNHASYTDALLLLAVLPPGIVFTAKKELLNTPIIRTFIKNLRYLTVDRLDFMKSIENKHQIEQVILQKNSVVIFPEGTFTYATGLRPFKLGAFTLAVETQTDVCPIAIAGTRIFLRDGSCLLKPVAIHVTIGKPITPEENSWEEIIRLRNQVRIVIARYCGEPNIDLVVAGVEHDSNK